MNIDKQIQKMLNKTYGYCPVDCKKCPKVVSQIKESILKAIMERFNELGKNFTGYAFSKGEIESVIKEILGGKE